MPWRNIWNSGEFATAVKLRKAIANRIIIVFAVGALAQVKNDVNHGRTNSAWARGIVAGAQIALPIIFRGIGVGLSIGLWVAETFWEERLYESLDK